MPCECGCGEEAKAGAFRPGHDQRLRANLERRVGGLLALRSLVESVEQLAVGQATPEELARKVKALMESAHE
jgi:hypothetical protein